MTTDTTYAIAAASGPAAERERDDAINGVGRLSQRELEVLIGVVNGRTNKEIALALGISHRTVEAYRANMMLKLELSRSALAIRMGMLAGLLSL